MRLFRSGLLAIGLVCVALSAAPAVARETPAAAAERLVAERLEQSGAPGLVAAVGYGGAVRWSGGWGYADLEQQVPMDPARTRLRIGSVIKPMTAYAAMLLAAEGKLDLDRPIQAYVEFPEKQAPITTRHLLSHQSGIRHYEAGEFMLRDHFETVTAGLGIFAADPLLHPPGTAYRYSSYGFNLAGAVIEGASGRSYLDFMAERVFKPLGMASVVPDDLSRIVPGRGRYYTLAPDGLENEPEVDNSYKWPSGGFVGSVEDLVRFGLAMLRSQGLGPEWRDRMWQEQRLANGEPTGYALGWRIRVLDGGVHWIGHTGGSVGGTTSFWIQPENGFVVALVSNQSSFAFDSLPEDLARLFPESGLNARPPD